MPSAIFLLIHFSRTVWFITIYCLYMKQCHFLAVRPQHQVCSTFTSNIIILIICPSLNMVMMRDIRFNLSTHLEVNVTPTLLRMVWVVLAVYFIISVTNLWARENIWLCGNSLAGLMELWGMISDKALHTLMWCMRLEKVMILSCIWPKRLLRCRNSGIVVFKKNAYVTYI